MSGKLPNAPVNFLAYDRANDTLVRGDRPRRLLRAEDDKHWKKLGDNLPNTATEDLKIQAASGKLYVGTFGRGTWRIPLVGGQALSTLGTRSRAIARDLVPRRAAAAPRRR